MSNPRYETLERYDPNIKFSNDQLLSIIHELCSYLGVRVQVNKHDNNDFNIVKDN